MYDSYGLKPDEDLEYATEWIRDSTMHHLTAILSHIKSMGLYSIVYNKKRMQQFKKGVNVCGRYSALFIRLQLTISQFNTLLDNARYTPDELVSIMSLGPDIHQLIDIGRDL